jgi:protease-4
VAASGGYYIASAANEIFVSEATLTGSIGVVGGKVVFGDALEKIGVHTETMRRGTRSAMISPLHPFTPEERVAITGMMQEMYDIFVDRIVEGRGMDRAKVLELAEGRVWTGEQALASGLVDKAGTLKDAVERARELAKLPGGPVEIYPKPKNFMEMIGEQLAEQEVRAISPLMRLESGRNALAFGALLYSNRVLAFAPISFEVR